MSLTQLWRTSREQLENKQIQQIIAFAGQGRLLDDSYTSSELREFLRHVPSETLCQYAEECLSNSFPDSGFALQDIVNEVGRRLGFNVENGRYKGIKGSIGHDGLWIFPNNHCVVVEVKTTDAYRIDSAKIAEYRKRLIANQKLEEEKSSILIIVGRQDTGDLEAQIRGSRYAWDIRLISVDALLRLMLLKESVEDARIVEKICQILIPKEFTRLDEIIEIVFFATEEAKQEIEISEALNETALPIETENSERVKPTAFHDACVERFSKLNQVSLVKRTRTAYSSPDNDTLVICAVSKSHQRQNQSTYWFAFHPYQKASLESVKNGYLVLGCGDVNKTLAIPISDVKDWLNSLWTTEKDGKMYWHIRIHDDGDELQLDRKQGIGRLELTNYLLPNK